jgi:hypothetical protein
MTERTYLIFDAAQRDIPFAPQQTFSVATENLSD